MKVSYCIGVHNEEINLKKSLSYICSNLDKFIGKNNYEIILINNGSTDKTADIIKGIINKKIRLINQKHQGHGSALRKGIKASEHDIVVLSALDFPFGISDLKTSLTYINNFDIIYGSKEHPKTQFPRPLKRRLVSLFYRNIIHILFGITISDTQGSVTLRKGKVLPILKVCDANTAFFSTQLAIYSNVIKLRSKEIPVKLDPTNLRPSRYNTFSIAKNMFIDLMNEFIKYRSKSMSLVSKTS